MNWAIIILLLIVPMFSFGQSEGRPETRETNTALKGSFDCVKKEVNDKFQLFFLLRDSVNYYIPVVSPEENEKYIPREIYTHNILPNMGDYRWMFLKMDYFSEEYQFIFLKEGGKLIQVKPFLSAKGSPLKFFSRRSWNRFFENKMKELMFSESGKERLEAYKLLKETKNPRWRLDIREKPLSEALYKNWDRAMTLFKEKGRRKGMTAVSSASFDNICSLLTRIGGVDGFPLYFYGQDTKIFGSVWMGESFLFVKDSMPSLVQRLFCAASEYMEMDDALKEGMELKAMDYYCEEIFRRSSRNDWPANPLLAPSGLPLDLNKWFMEWEKSRN